MPLIAVIVSQRFDSNKSHFAELDTLVRRIESRINQDDKEYSNLSQTSRVKLLEQYLRLLDVETKRLHGIHTAARMAIIHARNHPAMLLQKRKKTPSECSGSSGASSYYSCAPDLKLAVPPTS